MKAIVLPAYGNVDQLELRDTPEPALGANEINVRMAGASINPIDWKLRSGELAQQMPLELPTVLGKDASGVVAVVGPGVTSFKVGARVMGLINGGYAEHVVAAVDSWAEVPAELDLVDAGALPLVLLTGAQLIEEGVKPRKGDVVLVTGALGSVGRVAVFVAKSHGVTVWAGVRGSQLSAAQSLGADGVVSLDDTAAIANLPPLDGIADTVGGETVQKLLGKVKAGGVIGSVVGEPAGAKEHGLIVRALFAHVDSNRLGELARAVAERKLVIPIAKKLPLAAARDAQALAEKGAGGKVLLVG